MADLSDPRYTQYSEATPPDDSIARGIEGLTNVAVTSITEQQKSALRDEVRAAREEFDNSLTEEDVVVDPVSGSSPEDLINIPMANVVDNEVAKDTIDVNVREIAAMDGELKGVKRAVNQGLAPTRALEIKVEEITRRYMDRFPGLSTDFQRVAQQALGTDSNLLAASLNAAKDAERLARQQVETQEELFNQAAVKAGYGLAVHGATETIRAQARIAYLTSLQKEQQIGLLKQDAELAALQGQPTRAAMAANQIIAATSENMMGVVRNDFVNALPEALRSGGIQGIQAAVEAVPPEQRTGIIAELEAQKAVRMFEAQEAIATTTYADEATRARATNLANTIGALYDNMIESVSTGRLNEQMANDANIMANSNAYSFEKAFGMDKLFLNHIYAALPVTGSVQNQAFHQQVQRQYLPQLADKLGFESASSVLRGTPVEGDEEFIDKVNSANVSSMRSFLNGEEGSMDFNPNRSLAAMEIEFVKMKTGTKKQMLDTLGDPKFKEFLDNNKFTPEEQDKLDSLHTKIQAYGYRMTDRLAAELVRDLTEPRLRSQFYIKRTTEGTFRAAKPGEETGPLLTGDLVNVENGPHGLVIRRKSKAELEKLRVATDPDNLAKIDSMVQAMNRNLTSGLNSYTKALSNINPTNTQASLTAQILAEAVPTDAEVQQ